MNKNKKIGLIILVVVVLAGVFYGGVVYDKSKIPARGQAFGVGVNFGGIGGTMSTRAGNGGFTTGEIISKDDKSITVKLMDGGSKIIFLDTNTKISKQTSGTVDDLATGTQVSIMGTSNADGSENAESVQIRPQTMVK